MENVGFQFLSLRQLLCFATGILARAVTRRSGTVRSPCGRLGRMGMLKDGSARSDVSASTTWSFSANIILAICFAHIRAITMSAELTCPWANIRRTRARSRSAAALRQRPSSENYIINIVGFEFPIGTTQRSAQYRR